MHQRQPKFEVKKYLGTWYELAHYPSWFQGNDSYNVTATYTPLPNGKVKVHNSSIVNGKTFDSYGTATYLGDRNFRVEFPPAEVSKLVQSKEFVFQGSPLNPNEPNYVIDSLWVNRDGDYIYSVVTDPKKESFYLLSRFAHPSLHSYNKIIQYVSQNYDTKRIAQVPHYC